MILEAIRDPSKENPEDKLRLLLCFYFSSADNAIPKDDLAEYERALQQTGVDMGPWEFAKKCVAPLAGAILRDLGADLSLAPRLRDVMRMSNLGASPSGPAVNTPGGDLMRGFSSLSNRVRHSLPYPLHLKSR